MGYGKKEKPKEQEPLNIEPKRSATNLTVRPVPALWGTHRRGGTWLNDIFNYRTQAITERVKSGKKSKKTVTRGINYFGGVAHSVGWGPLSKVYKVLKGDEVVWDGLLSVDSSLGAPYFSIDIGERVPMILYTGYQREGTMRRAAQLSYTKPSPATITASGLFTAVSDSIFSGNRTDIADLTDDGFADAALPFGHPPYRNEIFWVFDQILFGQSPNPPNFEIIFQVIHKEFVLDDTNFTGDPRNDSDESHEADGGQFAPEIIYSALTNPLFGGRLGPNAFDLPSWIDACKRLKEEGLGYSASLDSPNNLDRLKKELLNYVAGDIIEDDQGRLKFILMREDDVRVSIPETAFLKDPQVSPNSWRSKDIINEARVNYATLENNLEERPEPAFDDASRITAGVRSKSFNLDGIRSIEAAGKYANRIVKTSGVPSVKYELNLTKEYDFIKKGALLAPVYPDYDLDGSRLLRVRDTQVNAPGKGGVTLRCEVDKLAIAAVATGETDGSLIELPPEPQAIRGRLCFLTIAQREEFLDGYMLCLSRQSNEDDAAVVSFGHDGVSYEVLQNVQSFPLGVTIYSWRDFGAGRFNVEIGFDHDHQEDEFLNSVTDGLPDFHLVTVLVDQGAETLQPVWSVVRPGTALQTLGNGRYILSMESGIFETEPYNAASGKFPSQFAYFGDVGNFDYYAGNQLNFERDASNAPSDTDRVRRFVIQSSSRGVEQDFSNGFAVEYNRANNIGSPNWGGGVGHDFDFAIAVTNANGLVPLTTQIELTGTENADVEILWGDGNGTSVNNQAMPFIMDHEYTAAGTYNGIVRVNPTAGGATQDLPFTVEVEDVPPLV